VIAIIILTATSIGSDQILNNETMTLGKLTAAIDKDPKRIDLLYQKALILYNQGKYDKVIESCETILKKDPSNEDAENLMIQAENKKAKLEGRTTATDKLELYNKTSFEELIKSYDQAIKSNHNNTNALINKGITLGEAGMYNESIACFDEAIRINSSIAEAWNNKGASLDRWGKHETSIENYDKAIKLDPQLAEAWHNKCKTVQLNLTNYLEAKKYCDKATEINPELKGSLGEYGGWIYKEMIKRYPITIN
jgi:tetratricopeptide (TPR) repeat protein